MVVVAIAGRLVVIVIVRRLVATESTVEDPMAVFIFLPPK
jgi:NhaP-type Na+/H+ or K+/H+ antiporter